MYDSLVLNILVHVTSRF